MNNLMKTLIRPHYLERAGYSSAGMESDKAADLIFLNANENPYSLPGLEGMNRYPEPQPKALLTAYAKLYGVKPEQVCATRGADEAINIILKLFCNPDDAIIHCPPTFGIYKIGAQFLPSNVIDVPLLETEGTYALNADEIITRAPEAKIIFLCSPNNPTATSFEPEEIQRIIAETAQTSIVVLDETYIELSRRESFCAKLEQYPNLIILRTLSKSYALAGLRMGCMINADAAFIQIARTKGLDVYPLPRASINAALHVMSDEILPLARENNKKLLAERDRVVEEFSQNPLVRHIAPSDANFFWVEMERAGAFSAHCTKNNVILRDFSKNPETKDYLRISIGTPQENDKLLSLLERFEE